MTLFNVAEMKAERRIIEITVANTDEKIRIIWREEASVIRKQWPMKRNSNTEAYY